jgi:poly-beta-1,6-N-acetyl-D-glucosamine biosynthesis protein PgaD
MQRSPIINVRKQLHWQHRLFSDASTAALWGFWLWLCRPVISVLGWLLGLGAGVQPALVQLMALNAPVSLERTALAVCSTSGTLLLWNLATLRRVVPERPRQRPDYARYFGLSDQQLQDCQDSRVSVVKHDDQGRIVSVERRITGS